MGNEKELDLSRKNINKIVALRFSARQQTVSFLRKLKFTTKQRLYAFQ